MIFDFRQKMLETSTKIFYKGIDENSMILHFSKEHPFAVERQKISKFFWQYLDHLTIPNHFIKTLSLREQLIKSAQTPSVFLVIHTVVSDELAGKLGLEIGFKLQKPLLEWHASSKNLQDPPLSREHLECFSLISAEQAQVALRMAEKLNLILRGFFYPTKLIPTKIEMHFGFIADSLHLINEITPNTFGLWDEKEMRQLKEAEAYGITQEIIKTLGL